MLLHVCKYKLQVIFHFIRNVDTPMTTFLTITLKHNCNVIHEQIMIFYLILNTLHTKSCRGDNSTITNTHEKTETSKNKSKRNKTQTRGLKFRKAYNELQIQS